MAHLLCHAQLERIVLGLHTEVVLGRPERGVDAQVIQTTGLDHQPRQVARGRNAKQLGFALPGEPDNFQPARPRERKCGFGQNGRCQQRQVPPVPPLSRTGFDPVRPSSMLRCSDRIMVVPTRSHGSNRFRRLPAGREVCPSKRHAPAGRFPISLRRRRRCRTPSAGGIGDVFAEQDALGCARGIEDFDLHASGDFQGREIRILENQADIAPRALRVCRPTG